MSRINVDLEAFTDPRFERLAQLLSLADADHARSKVEWLWLDCTTRGETSLPQWLVEKRLGPQGPTALIESELARWASGRGDSKTRRMYIRGARGRTEWLTKNREQSSNGGKSRARNASRAAGRFTSRAAGGVTSPPAPAPAPAQEESSPPLALVRDTDEPKPQKRSQKAHPDQQQVIDAFHQRFLERYQTKPTWDAKARGQIGALLKNHPAAELVARMDFMFAGKAKWPPPPYSLDVFAKHIDRWVEELDFSSPQRRVVKEVT